MDFGLFWRRKEEFVEEDLFMVCVVELYYDEDKM